jgi:hypothetical protein
MEKKKLRELDEYERYGYDGDRPCAFYDDLDVTICPRCESHEILPGQRVCTACYEEIMAE